MGSEVEIPETPNWLKELEEKRARRLRTKLGHELGAGAICLTCEDKCPGLDLHFWRKICKNCKCSKENHEVHDDDIYGWAQDELLGTKVKRLKKKIVLLGRKEVELEWAPNGQTETIDKYLKLVPTELLPIKGSQAAQNRKQLLKKQIPIHDIDPIFCHELNDDELKKMQEYISHIKQSSVGIGNLIQINLGKSSTHVLDKNEAMFVINNMPKVLINSENVALKESQNSVSLKNLTNAIGGLTMKNRHRLAVQEPNMIISPDNDEQNPLFTTIRNKNSIDSLSTHDTNNLGISPIKYRVPTTDIQDPQKVTIRNISYPENIYDNITADQNMKPCDAGKIRNIQYLAHNVPVNSNFVPLNQSNNNYPLGDVTCVTNLDNNSSKLEQYSSLSPLNAKKSNLNEDPQQFVKFKNIKDLAYSTYNSPPVEIQGGDHNLLSKDCLNSATRENISGLRRTNSTIPGMGSSPNTLFTTEQRENAEITQVSGLLPSDIKAGYNKSINEEIAPVNYNYQETVPSNSLTRGILPESLFPQTDYIIKPSQSLNEGVKSSQSSVIGMSSPRIGLESNMTSKRFSGEATPNSRTTNYSNLPIYHPGSENIQEEHLQPTIIPIGSIKDVEYTEPEISVALSKDDNLVEGSVPSKFMANPNMANLPCCHNCKENFKQDELAIAIPERSNAVFHTDCFKCQGCNQILADMFYFYDKDTDDIYCGRDYAKIRGIPRCRACDELIFVKEYCLAENSTFHVKHFCCFECDTPLAGRNYVMENDQPLCVPCYEITKANKCYACKDVIHPDQQGLQLKEGVHFHATEECFACKICKKPLFGAKLLFRNYFLYCSHDCYSSDI